MRYNFLLLCALFASPPLCIALLRKDLRRPMWRCALLSLPFAFTESWFYGEYWRPTFLFDLADKLGFGIEDFLFVMALGAFTCGVYPFAMRRQFEARTGATIERSFWRLMLALVGLLAVVLIARELGVPTLFAACLAMVCVSASMLAIRRDLLVPCALGGGLTLLVYGALCEVFALLLPGVFRLAWNTAQLTNVFIFGVPLEELVYGFSAGLIGTCAYPFLTNQAFRPRKKRAAWTT